MKIALVRPPYYAALGSEEKIGNIPLGLCYVGAYLEKHGHEVDIIDCEKLNLTERKNSGKAQSFLKWNMAYPVYTEIMSNPNHPVWDDVAESIIETEPDLIGFTSYTPTMSFVNYVSRKIKSKCNTPILLGGPHPTSLPELSLKESQADFVIQGEGELTILKLINNLDSSEKICRGERIESLDELPYPARHLLNTEDYYKEAFGYIITSRGCPFQCIFCASHKIWGHKTRYRSVDNIVDEIIEVQDRYNLNSFRFADDLFPISHKRMKLFADTLESRDCRIRFRCGSRADITSLGILTELKRAGCDEISFGVESGSQRILDLIDKGITLEKIRNTIKMTKDLGIKTTVFFMIGHPTETIEDIEQSISLIEELDADRTHLNLVMPLPGTKLAEYAGELPREWWKYYFHGKTFCNISNVDNSKLDQYFRKICEWAALRNERNE